MNSRCWLALLLCIPAGACQGPGGNPKPADLARRKVQVVATTGMITDAVRQVGGERVEVTGLMGPGTDPHLYKASEGDVGRMEQADVIFYNGLHLEGQMGQVLEQMQRRIKAVAVTSALDMKADVRPAPPGFEGSHDPHVWFDVRLWMKAVGGVRDALAELDPTHAETYRANAARYLDELGRLHEEVKAKAEKVPKPQRVLITAHDAFYYFGHAYGFEVRSLQGVSTAAEPGVADVQELADFIVGRRIPAIFIESSVPRKNVEAVQAAVRAKGFRVEVGGELNSDALGSPGTPAESYAGMVRHNIDTIVTALLPEAGK
jgi:manganese/zinc/iron transport system substrate-binding protein